jgi:cellulose biosynthesis protein BcsQ
VITYTVYSEAGGTYKTTTTANTAVAHARDGLDVLAIDLDPQEGSLSYIFDVDEDKRDGDADNLARHMIDRPNGAFEALVHTTHEGVDVIPSHAMLENLSSLLDRAQEIEEMSHGADDYQYERYRQLHRVLAENDVPETYDVVLIDPQATASDALYNAIYATRTLVSPVELSGKGSLSLAGLDDLVWNLERELEIEVGVAAVVPGNVGRTRANARYREELEDAGWDVPVVIGERESLMQEMWDAQASAFEVVESAYVDGRAGRRREREREQETLEKYQELARHLEATFEGG